MTDEEIERRISTLESDLAKSRTDWQALHDQVVTMLARSAGLRAGWLYLLGAIAAMGTAVSIVQILTS